MLDSAVNLHGNLRPVNMTKKLSAIDSGVDLYTISDYNRYDAYHLIADFEIIGLRTLFILFSGQVSGITSGSTEMFPL